MMVMWWWEVVLFLKKISSPASISVEISKTEDMKIQLLNKYAEL
jgi:hypothetical protein